MTDTTSGGLHHPSEGLIQRHWNVKRLGERLVVDATSAGVAAAIAAPMVTVIDKAVIEHVSGRAALLASICASLKTLLYKPHQFLFARPVAIMSLLYGSTYLSANTIDTVSSSVHGRAASTTTSGLAKFGATSTVNLSMALYKDSQFARMFGITSVRSLPPASYPIFIVRDCLTVFASFNLPAIISPRLPLSMENHISRASVAQITAPAFIQLLGTPLHILGLDLYNRNRPISAVDRLKKILIDWPKVSLTRMCRVIPAFGIGGLVNSTTRSRLMKSLDAIIRPHLDLLLSTKAATVSYTGASKKIWQVFKAESRTRRYRYRYVEMLNEKEKRLTRTFLFMFDEPKDAV